jgi:hypothetical protein
MNAKPPPPTRDPEIFDKGETVFVTHSISPDRMERWVLTIASFSEQRVDWHFVDGRAVVKAIGDIARVKREIAEWMPVHDHIQRESIAEMRSKR